MATMTSKSFLGAQLATTDRRSGPSRSRVVTTEAFFANRKKDDKKEVERYKKSEVVKAKKLLPWDVKWSETQPERGLKQEAARNTPRQGGFGQGLPYQKTKIGQKMEGTAVPSNIDPIYFAIGLSGFTVVVVAGLILSQ